MGRAPASTRTTRSWRPGGSVAGTGTARWTSPVAPGISVWTRSPRAPTGPPANPPAPPGKAAGDGPAGAGPGEAERGRRRRPAGRADARGAGDDAAARAGAG